MEQSGSDRKIYYIKMFPVRTVSEREVLGVPIVQLSLVEVLAWIRVPLPPVYPTRARTVCLVNALSVVEANRNPQHMAALKDADVCLADGMGVALLARTPKIAGADLMLAAARHPKLGKMRHVLLGGFGVAYDAAHRQWWEAGILPVHKPWIPDTPAHDDLVEWANGVPCDILWIALGCPKQERWMQKNRHRLRAKVIIAVGAAFDMLAGRTSRAPGWMRPIGLEWAWRIHQEPLRWRRQVDAAVGFLRLLCR